MYKIMKKEIVIYGAGWLGLPLALKFALNHYEVWISPKPKEFELPANVFPIDFRFTKEIENFPKFMFEKQIQIWAIPPRLTKNKLEEYLGFLKFWINHIPKNNPIKIVFTSSTSIYCDGLGEVDENGILCEESSMFQAEKIIQESGLDFLIFRLGGLMGKDRYPAKYFSRKIIREGNSRVNYIHQKDVIDFIFEGVEKGLSGIYNLVAPVHPLKKELALKDCKNREIPPPKEIHSKSNNKIINSQKIMRALNKKFTYPDPMKFPID